MPDVSIAISAQDNFSTAIARMQNATRSFSKDAEGLDRKMTALNRNKATLSVDVRNASKELREAQRAYDDLMKAGNATAEAQEEASRRIVNATEDYDRARQNMSLLTREISNTRREMDNLYSSQERNENRMVGRASTNSSGRGIMAGFAAQMIGESAKELLSNYSSAYFSSLYGTQDANILNQAMSGSITGATAGAMVGGAPGAAIGGGIGLVTGVANGILQNKNSGDDFFKNLVQEQYNAVKQTQSDNLSSGTGLAGGREVDQLSFTTLLGGDSGKAQNFLKSIVDFSNATPFLYDDLTSMSKTLLTYKYSENEMMGVLQNIGDAGAALGMDTQNMNMVATGLGRMRSSGKTSLEYINLMQERGIDAIGALAEAHGITNAKVYESISKNLFDGAESAEIISKYMEKNYGGSMLAISETYNGLLSTVEGLNDEINNAMGEGYTEKSKEGLQEEIDWFEKGWGSKEQEANRIIGEAQAAQENYQKELERLAMQEVLMSDEYIQAKAKFTTAKAAGDEEGIREYGAKVSTLLSEAQIKAQNDYYESDAYKTLQNANVDLIKRIQVDSKDIYHQAGYDLGQTFTTGIEAAIKEAYVRNDTTMYKTELSLEERGAIGATVNNISNGVTVSGNSFNVREEADIDKVARSILDNIQKADMSYGK